MGDSAPDSSSIEGLTGWELEDKGGGETTFAGVSPLWGIFAVIGWKETLLGMRQGSLFKD